MSSIQQISFARTRSDAVVKELEGDDALVSHKEKRLEHKRKLHILRVFICLVSDPLSRQNTIYKPLEAKAESQTIDCRWSVYAPHSLLVIRG